MVSKGFSIFAIVLFSLGLLASFGGNGYDTGATAWVFIASSFGLAFAITALVHGNIWRKKLKNGQLQ